MFVVNWDCPRGQIHRSDGRHCSEPSAHFPPKCLQNRNVRKKTFSGSIFLLCAHSAVTACTRRMSEISCPGDTGLIFPPQSCQTSLVTLELLPPSWLMVVSSRRRKTVWEEPQFVQAGVAQWHSPGRFVFLQQQLTCLQAELASCCQTQHLERSRACLWQRIVQSLNCSKVGLVLLMFVS